MKKVIILIIFILLSAAIFQVSADDKSTLSSKLDKIIQLSINENRIPNLAVSAVKSKTYSREELVQDLKQIETTIMDENQSMV